MIQTGFDNAAAIVVSRQLIWMCNYLKRVRFCRVSTEFKNVLRESATLCCELVHDTFTDEGQDEKAN